MVEIPKDSRRKVLKMAGSAMVGLTAYTGSSGAVKNNKENYDESIKINRPKYTDDMTGASVFGSYDNPIGQKTIDKIHENLAQHSSKGRNGGIPLPNLNATPDEEYHSEQDQNRVLGYSVKWRNGSPLIQVKREPKIVMGSNNTVDSLPIGLKKNIEKTAHKETLDFVNNKGVK